MLKLHSLEIQNFKSFGDKKTVVNFDALPGITLFMGENEDIITPDSRNGCGKSSILDALAWVLCGKPIKKRRDPNGVLNKINGKKCQVTLHYTFHGVECRIERGIKPSFLKYYENEEERTRSSIAETQAHIYGKLKLDIDLIRFILISAAKTEGFFQLDSADQKKIVETLFGFETLTVKAASLKERRQKAEVKLQIENSKIQERESAHLRFVAQLEQVVNQHAAWDAAKERQIEFLSDQITDLEQFDFDYHEERINYFAGIRTTYQDAVNARLSPIGSLKIYNEQLVILYNTISNTKDWIKNYSSDSVENYINEWKDYTTVRESIDSLEAENYQCNINFQQLLKQVSSVKLELDSIKDHCPTCHQTWPDQDVRQAKLNELTISLINLEKQKSDVERKIEANSADVIDLQTIDAPYHPLFKTLEEANRAQVELDLKNKSLIQLEADRKNAENQIAILQVTINEFDDIVNDTSVLLEQNTLEVKTLEELNTKKNVLARLVENLDTAINSSNPHQETLDSLKKETLETINTTVRDALEDDVQHLVYLEKLLTKKDSPIRRLVISKWLPKLNELIAYYLTASELPYTVIFEDDLTATIKDFEIEMDFADLSSGEEERVSMAMSWAFRDVFENINYPINFMAVDERLDAGLDGAGGQASINILQDMAVSRDRRTFLVSHRKELIDYADQILMVKKKGRFSRIERML